MKSYSWAIFSVVYVGKLHPEIHMSVFKSFKTHTQSNQIILQKTNDSMKFVFFQIFFINLEFFLSSPITKWLNKFILLIVLKFK